MDLVLKGHGARISENVRKAAARKLERLARMEPRAIRVEVEVVAEPNPRQGGVKRVEAALRIPRKVFRAHAEGSDIESALDLLAERLERQLRDHHGKRRKRSPASANRLKSAGTSTGELGPVE